MDVYYFISEIPRGAEGPYENDRIPEEVCQRAAGEDWWGHISTAGSDDRALHVMGQGVSSEWQQTGAPEPGSQTGKYKR